MLFKQLVFGLEQAHWIYSPVSTLKPLPVIFLMPAISFMMFDEEQSITYLVLCRIFSSLSHRCDLVTCLGTNFRRGAGVLDIVYESPFQLLTCGYDTFIRYWDLRVCSRYVRWEEKGDLPCPESRVVSVYHSLYNILYGRMLSATSHALHG